MTKEQNAPAPQAEAAPDDWREDVNTVLQHGTCHELSNQDELHRYVEARDRLLNRLATPQASQPAAGDGVVLPARIENEFGFLPEVVHYNNIRNAVIDEVARLNPAAKPAASVPVEWQFKDDGGKWCNFHSNKHRDDTIADGRWEVRPLYATPPTPAGAVRVAGLRYRVVRIGHDDEGTTSLVLLSEWKYAAGNRRHFDLNDVVEVALAQPAAPSDQEAGK